MRRKSVKHKKPPQSSAERPRRGGTLKNTMNERQIKFDQVKKGAEEQYKKINNVFCPFLKRDVNFNAKGLDHIKFKGWNKARLTSEQYLRLKFLKLTPLVIEKASTLQEFSETKVFERKKINSRWERILTPVKYYGFVAIINFKVKIKIIVKEAEGGQPFFWSVIPFWKTKKDPITEQTKKVFHEGDLEKQ